MRLRRICAAGLVRCGVACARNSLCAVSGCCVFFFFNDTATTEIYTLSLHDALPICEHDPRAACRRPHADSRGSAHGDRKSTRLNSSHLVISYAVFCLKNKRQGQAKGFSLYLTMHNAFVHSLIEVG